jgi:thioredoxin-dependent peroxiredoxin
MSDVNKLVGTVAHDFNLSDKDNHFYSLNQLTKENDFIVLYFYPKDDTPGCTIEAQMFTKNLNEFKKLKTLILGISGGDNKSKEKFCNKYDLKINLLSDIDFSVSKKYKVYEKKQMYGKEYYGISRITFIINKKKEIIKVFEKVDPKNHSKEVLEFIESTKNIKKGE